MPFHRIHGIIDFAIIAKDNIRRIWYDSHKRLHHHNSVVALLILHWFVCRKLIYLDFSDFLWFSEKTRALKIMVDCKHPEIVSFQFSTSLFQTSPSKMRWNDLNNRGINQYSQRFPTHPATTLSFLWIHYIAWSIAARTIWTNILLWIVNLELIRPLMTCTLMHIEKTTN